MKQKKIRVGVVGPGTIGHKVIWAIEKQDDMSVSGGAKTTPDWVAKWVVNKGYKLYPSSKEGAEGVPKVMAEFEQILGKENIAGTIEDLLDESDVIVDCTGNKFGEKNKQSLYEPYNKKHGNRLKVLFQGGEKADIGPSFNTRTSYMKCAKSGSPYLRVVSCNTTGLARLMGPLVDGGYEVDYLTASLLRRSTDPGIAGKMRLDGTEVSLKIPSHHAPDLQQVLGIEAYSRAYKVPVDTMHMHDLQIVFKKKAPTKAEFAKVYEKDNRVALLETFDSTSELRERVRRLNKIEDGVFPGGDVFMSCVSSGSYYVFREKTLWLSQGIPQDSIVVPETVDAIRAATYADNKINGSESMRKTDETIGFPRMKRILEQSYQL
jgi:glyceraldehyde-3-phosphate dehydrogenase (NAD(P))